MGINSISGENNDDLKIKRQKALEKTQSAETEQVSSTCSVNFSSTDEDGLIEFKDETLTTNSAKSEEEIQAEKLKKALEDDEIDMVEFMSLISSNSKLNKIAAELGYGVLFDKLDTNHDGVINGDELKKVLGKDGDVSDIEMSDLEKFLTDTLQSLIEKTDDSSQNNELNKETSVEDKKDTAQNVAIKSGTQNTAIPIASSGGYVNTGGVSDMGYMNGNASISEQIREQENNKAIKTQELNNKNAELKAVQDGTDSDIVAKQEVIDKTKEEYDQACAESNNPLVKAIKGLQDQNEEALKADEENIENANSEIEKTNSEMSTQQGNIETYTGQISSIESSISSLNSQKGQEGADTSSINSRISLLNSQKTEAQNNKNKAQEAYDKAKSENEKAKKNLEESEKTKEEHEKQKDKLIELMKKIASEEITQKLDAYIEAQNDLETTKTTKIEKINAEIQTIQNQITEIESRITELKVRQSQGFQSYGGTYGTGSIQQIQALYSGTIADMDGNSGQKLLNAALSLYGNNPKSHGRCGTGVSNAVYQAFGCRIRGNGNQWGNLLAQRSDWVEITDQIKSVDELSSLPAGAIVSWSKSGADYESQTYGHVYISDGNGGEISDFYSRSVLNSNRKRAKYGTFRVFVPKGTNV